jgi:hypothetical protein
MTTRSSMRTSLTRWRLFLGGGLVLGMLMLSSGAGHTLAHGADGHPAKIHEGTCAALGRVAFPLTGVGAAVDLDQTPIATPAPVNPQSSAQVISPVTKNG